jgi:hypothetical protein
MPHVSRQKRQLGLNVDTLPVPADQSIYGKAVTLMPMSA